jgi:DtxR family Mn-dependent transcriptional regulator
MADLIDTTEMYLRTIYELEEENIFPLRARISERLGHSGPTVSQTVGRMERDGLVVVEVIGLDWALVHEEACRWEHVMSESVERRIIELLEHPTHSPYGNPIPGLDELGEHAVGQFSDGVVNIVNYTLGAVGPISGVIRRLGEPVQYEVGLLEQLRAAGVVPGAKASFTTVGSYVLVQAEGHEDGLELPTEVAVHVYVGI